MSLLDETRYIERQQFFPGELLTAPDLQRIEQFNREMRWLHNKSLHQPGIGNGFAIYGKKGDRQVLVGAGYGADSEGREIISTGTETLPIPPVAGEPDGQPALYDLVVSYPDDAALDETETRDGVCYPRGVVRRREAPIFCWVRLNRGQEGPTVERVKLKQEIQAGLRIVIARIQVLNCQLYADVSIEQRRSARLERTPRIVTGKVTRPNWVAIPVPMSAQAQSGVALLQADVNTAAGNFTLTPSYWARIQGAQPLRKDSVFALSGPISIQDAKTDFFRISVWVITNGTLDNLEPFRAGWSIVWMGIEE